MSRLFRAQVTSPRPVLGTAGGPSGSQEHLDPAAVLRKAQDHALALVAKAKEESSQTVEMARQRAAAKYNEAVQEGYDKGYEQGFQEGTEKAHRLVLEAEMVLQAARDAFDAMLREAEPKLLVLSLEAASRILRREFQTDPGLTLQVIRQGMAALRDEREFSLVVNPSLQEMVGDACEVLKREFGASAVEVAADSEVRDGAIVRTPGGFVDATVEGQIRNLALALGEARRINLGVAGQ